MGGIIGAIGSLLGGAPNNANFTAQATNVAQPVNVGQANTAYGQAQSGLTQEQQLINALTNQNGIQNQSNVVNQLQGVANGTGPNPALDQLNQTTGQNIQNQAALMAGQRGASVNPALIARQAAQQGAATQQNAVGQAATLNANQQLGALGQLGGLTTQQVNQQMGAVTGLNSAAQNEQNQLLNSIAQNNNANVSQQNAINAANADVANNNADNTASAIGGLASGLASATGLVAAPTSKARGGSIENPKLPPSQDRYSGSLYPDHIKKMGEFYHGTDFKMGGKVPGKAQVKGDSQKNDTVPAMLSPGEFVIPKSVMESKDPQAGAAKMIADYMKKQGDGKKFQSDFKSALSRAMIQTRKNK